MKKVFIDEFNYLRTHEDLLDAQEETDDEYIESPEQAQANYEMSLRLKEELYND